jgi:RNA polymerase sigma-70 factor (ECF subfamily)
VDKQETSRNGGPIGERTIGATALRAPEYDVKDAVSRAQAGEQAAFEELYRAHSGRVYALCLRMTADTGRAEELSQDVFLRAWTKLSTFRGDAAFSTWLHRLAVNVVLADRRSQGKRWARLVGTDELEPYEGVSARAGLSEPAEAPRGARLDLEGAIAGLPEGARKVFVLYEIEGYRHEDIAQMTGTAVGTSKAQLHRARKLLREALQK